MTGKAFLKRLMFQLDFLNQEEQKAVIAYYEKKLASVAEPTQEESIVKSFGSPEHIAEKLKESYRLHKGVSESAENVFPNDSEQQASVTPVEKEILPAMKETKGDPHAKTEAFDETVSEEKTSEQIENSNDCAEDNSEEIKIETFHTQEMKTAENDDLIFSKPLHEEKVPEIVQSLENKELKPLMGEKVIIESRSEPVEEIILEPSDEKNGLTIEEIDQAKQETLEKAKNYNTAAFGVNTVAQIQQEAEEEAEDTDEEEPEDITEESEEPIQDESEDNEENYREFEGIFNILFATSNLSENAIRALKILLTVLISPVLFVVFSAGIILYAAITFAILLCAFVLFALMAACVVIGIVELIYGFVMLFDTVSVALIELGVGTVLFSVVVAAVGLIYEFLFGITPRSLKFITKLCKHYLRLLRSWLYGGRA